MLRAAIARQCVAAHPVGRHVPLSAAAAAAAALPGALRHDSCRRARPAGLAQQQRRCFGRANLYLSSKNKSDAKRAGAFTKLCNEIWSAARDGGPDPAGNHRLALAIVKAKDANVPKANIERALAR
jgi:hypothetical protein